MSSLRLIDVWTGDSPFLLDQRPFAPRCCCNVDDDADDDDDLDELVFVVVVFSERVPPVGVNIVLLNSVYIGVKMCTLTYLSLCVYMNYTSLKMSDKVSCDSRNIVADIYIVDLLFA